MTEKVSLYHGDCLSVLKTMPEASVDSVVTDPPYGLAFMGKRWDYDVPPVDVWAECLRVLKPGGHLLAFAGTRTQHRMAARIEDAGFEIRDMIAWVYGTGFPKSHNLDGDWQGWGTALKPALEPVTVARKPLDGIVAANVLEHGTGAMNIDGCRVEGEGGMRWETPRGGIWATDPTATAQLVRNDLGRWPANLIHDGSDEVLAGFPESAGAQSGVTGAEPSECHNGVSGGSKKRLAMPKRGDTGSAARFFYCAKASKSERGEGNTHPTVKPIALMRYLCRLVTPPGGLVLDPFMGSGTTGVASLAEGFRFVGIEREALYVELARQRICGTETASTTPA